MWENWASLFMVRWNLSLSLLGEVIFACSRFTKLMDQVIIVALFQIELFNICYVMSNFFIPQMIIGSLVCVRPCRRCLGTSVNKTRQRSWWHLLLSVGESQQLIKILNR